MKNKKFVITSVALDIESMRMMELDRQKLGISRSVFIRGAIRTANVYGVRVPPVFHLTATMIRKCFPTSKSSQRKKLKGYYYSVQRCELSPYQILGTNMAIAGDVRGPFVSRNVAINDYLKPS